MFTVSFFRASTRSSTGAVRDTQMCLNLSTTSAYLHHAGMWIRKTPRSQSIVLYTSLLSVHNIVFISITGLLSEIYYRLNWCGRSIQLEGKWRRIMHPFQNSALRCLVKMMFTSAHSLLHIFYYPEFINTALMSSRKLAVNFLSVLLKGILLFMLLHTVSAINLHTITCKLFVPGHWPNGLQLTFKCT